MKKRYKLYEVRLINEIPMLYNTTSCLASNIVEAEFMFENDMKAGIEYLIFLCK